MNVYGTSTTNTFSNIVNAAFTRPTYYWTTSNTATFTAECAGASSWVDNEYIQKMIAQQKERNEREARRQEELLSSFEEVFA